MQINKHGSFYIRNGWPTKIIDSVCNNNTIFSPNNEEEAVDVIGVGRVMIKALRYWAAVLGITKEAKTQQGITHSLTDLGQLINDYDPYCQVKGTLWLLHRNLACDEENATAWAWAFNYYLSKTFSKDDFVGSFYSFVQRNGESYPKNSIEKEFGCFKNTYVSDTSFNVKKIIEEDTVPFFAPLQLITYSGGGQFEKRKICANEIPLSVFFYCILKDNYELLEQGNTQISLDHLLEDNFQVGKYMNLGYSVLLELLQQLENKKQIIVVNNFGNRYIQVQGQPNINMLIDYYKGL